MCCYSTQAEESNAIKWRARESNGGIILGGGYGYPAVPQDTKGDLVIPSELGGLPVTGIDVWAFHGCKQLTSVTIPDSVTFINGAAFMDCTGLTTVSIGTNVNYLGVMCFQGCSRLQSVEIPNGVTSIPAAAFARCSSLGRVKIGNGVKKLSGSVHSSVLTGLGGQTVTINESPFAGCTSLYGIELGTAVETVEWGTFEHCTNLKYVYCPRALPVGTGSIPGGTACVCYVTHEAYPDGLPYATVSGATLAYLEGDLPTDDVPWDLRFYRPSGWPSTFFLSSEKSSTVARTRFLAGNPIYSSFAFEDAWGCVDILNEFDNWVYVYQHGMDGWTWGGLERDCYGVSEWKLPDCLQGLPPGEYTVVCYLNFFEDIAETDYDNNDMAIDSMGFILVICRCEAELGVKIPERRWQKLSTFGEVVDEFMLQLKKANK